MFYINIKSVQYKLKNQLKLPSPNRTEREYRAQHIIYTSGVVKYNTKKT